MTSNSILWYDEDYFRDGEEVNAQDPPLHQNQLQP
jgi:hypothetical protein